jgi:hypothetical protein
MRNPLAKTAFVARFVIGESKIERLNALYDIPAARPPGIAIPIIHDNTVVSGWRIFIG